ncbi:unnamed protein product [Heligmosomoides polygyrus]|uniref:Augmin complex subunit wac n=1 Tax=Heligmosomoides polygyrus TaxID=6339 RepID=A0A183G6S3_HELPZ|nr:unnamed protein product [Heligmosomoides polygyrus]
MASENVNDLEMERMLLDEPTESDRIAALQASIDTLVGAVREIVQKGALQVRLSAVTIADKLSVLEDIPSSLVHPLDGDTTTVGVDHLSKVMEEFVQANCKTIHGELARLEFVRTQLSKAHDLLQAGLHEELREQLEQAKYDDSCMRELAQVLGVDTTEVVGRVKSLVQLPREVKASDG